jgi:O-antigen/teichoic acid export membrane protein
MSSALNFNGVRDRAVAGGKLETTINEVTHQAEQRIAVAEDPPSVGASAEGLREGSEPHHFATEHLLIGLKGRTVSSGIITAVAQAVQFVLNLGSIMVLARLLTPNDFGLVAMVGTVMGFLRIFNEAGLSTATVQREGITHAQVSNLFWTNVVLGGLISLILALASPAIARFYHEPRLVGITLALCITFLLTGSTVQHLALLKRQMRFKMIAVIQLASMAAGVMVGIAMAWLEYGYWSLVGMQLSTPAVAFVLTWSASRWRPQSPTRSSGTRSLLGFGANLTASSFMWSLAKGSDGLLIGRYYGSAALGLYSRAQSLLLRPIEQFTLPLEAVFLPTLSRLQSQPARYRRIVLQVFETIAVAGFMFSGLLLALAHPLTLVVLGSKWQEAAAIFAGFTLVALYAPVASVSSWLLASQGRGKDFLMLSTIASLVTVASFVVGLPFGPAAVAVSYSAACLLILLPLAYHLAGRHGPVTTKDLWVRFFTHLPLFGIVCVATWLMRGVVGDLAPLAQVLICGSVGFLMGATFISVYPPARRVASSLIDALREWKRSRNNPSGVK